MEQNREVLRNTAWALLDEGFESDQQKGVPPPAIQVLPQDAVPDVALPDARGTGLGERPIAEVLAERRSRRKFTDAPVSIEELSFLMWATQGVARLFRGGAASFRQVPSGGARHPFETILALGRVTGIEPGLYRYMPCQHGLKLIAPHPGTAAIARSCYGQTFVGEAPVVFYWTAVPYRTEWRYGPASPKLIAVDAGHLCENLYLAAEALGLGTCAIGAYDQAASDILTGVDGRDEFVIYIAPVGRVP
jgi:SagB-type dehydrogenase family enzyme